MKNIISDLMENIMEINNHAENAFRYLLFELKLTKARKGDIALSTIMKIVIVIVVFFFIVLIMMKAVPGLKSGFSGIFSFGR